mmetsp:Transcript_44792/g.124531  ORF Transcript_44792/g.124531 Transcript_44792/m.124531 type:complete len:209 (-) Transcript_44792:194-820(-)
MLEGSRSGHACGLSEFMGELPCVHRVQQVDVARRTGLDLEGQLSAVARGAERRRELVRVAAVLQRPLRVESHGLRRRRLRDLPREPAAHAGIVRCGERVGRCRQFPAEGQGRAVPVLAHLLDQLAVLGGTRHHGHRGVVLRGGSDHGGPANVNVLYACGEVTALSHGLCKGIQVDDHEVDPADAMLAHLGLVLCIAPRSQESAVDLRV